MPDYEVLVDVGQVPARRRLIEPVLIGDMGDGYYRAAVIGSLEGTFAWTLNWSGVHRDQPLIQRITKNNAFLGPPVPRARYLIEFYHSHMSNGAKSFWFTDFDRTVSAGRIARLCHFTSPIFEMTQSGTNRLLYSYTVEFMQSRGVAAQSLLMEEEELESNAESLTSSTSGHIVS